MSHSEIHRAAIICGRTVVFQKECHQSPYREFATGSLLSRNNEYPSGLVIMNGATPVPFKDAEETK